MDGTSPVHAEAQGRERATRSASDDEGSRRAAYRDAVGRVHAILVHAATPRRRRDHGCLSAIVPLVVIKPWEGCAA